MDYELALKVAEKVKELLAPHCEKIEIAGSIRRKKPKVKDIEIVAIPKPYGTGLFQSGIAEVVNQWQKVKGELPCKYTQRIIPLNLYIENSKGDRAGVVQTDQGNIAFSGQKTENSIKLDLFFANPLNWGLQLAIRTGSAEYSHKVLATGWVKKGYKSEGGHLFKGGEMQIVSEEKDLFDLIGIDYVEPEKRNL